MLNIAYKDLTGVLCVIRKSIINKLIGPYHCGFRPAKSTIGTDLHNNPNPGEDPDEKKLDIHHIYINFKATFDITDKNQLYASMSEFGKERGEQSESGILDNM